MSFNDSLSDMLTRIRNAHKVNQNVTHCFSSNLNSNVLKVLKDEGYIRDYSKIDIREGVSKIKIELKYYQGLPVIKKIKRISTPKGVMSDQKARANNVGGEILCEVF